MTLATSPGQVIRVALLAALLASFLAVGLETQALAQDEAATNEGGTASEEEADEAAEESKDENLPASYENTVAGEFTPGQGFDLIKTKRGSLNISMYGLFRYLNQQPSDDTSYVDHLGNVRPVVLRHDINWHRTMIWLSGFFWVPNFQYTLTVWSLPTTEQNMAFGMVRFAFHRGLVLGLGLGPNMTARTVMGPWPFLAGSDRQMAEEFYRGGFSSAAFLMGEPIDRFFYAVSINRSLSQLGVPALLDNRDFAYSATVFTMPTTGEFGPRGGFGDLEEHQRVATRFGLSGGHARTTRGSQLPDDPRQFAIRLSDGVNPFQLDALADGVTLTDLDYNELAIDAGLKYKGLSLQAEWGIRYLNDFEADGPLPEDSILDNAFYVQGMYMVVPRNLGVYATVGALIDEFERYPWELSGGVSYYPFQNRSLRVNFHYIHIDQSPVGSAFGYYSAGQTGNTFSLGADILL